VVVEFKLGSLLGEHQDPNQRRFSTDGYGIEIENRYEKSGKKLLYRVVGSDVGSNPGKRGLDWDSIPWSKFCQHEESKIEIDLYDCLGTLGVPAFLSRNMKKKCLSDEARNAMEVYALLKNAAGDIPLGQPVSDIDHVGVDLSAKRATPGSRHQRLMELVKPDHRSLGWIGYEQLEKGLCLSVWFYCSKKQANSVRKILLGVKPGELIVNDTDVGICRLAKEEEDHMLWIESVLNGAGKLST
jgi:hypothetical protein